MQYLTKPFPIPLDRANDSEYVANKLRRLLHINKSDISHFSLRKRSVDARDKSNVHFVCSYVVDCGVTPQNAVPYDHSPNVLDAAPRIDASARCVVVGAGPAGLFAALYLCKCGLNVTVIERGADVSERKQAVQRFFDGGEFDPRANVQFGLGGAGAFSDGKLTSNLSATPLGRSVFESLVAFGAPESILYDALPHVGTDNLETVVSNLRNAVIANGGSFMFGTQVTNLIRENGTVRGVVVQKDGKTEQIYADYTLLACGNSARDTFEMLFENGAQMQFKPFAVGLRIEHKREAINSAQYGSLFATHRDLGAASYKLTHKCADGHGCYSFCMCPGGVVVAANSQEDTVVVNGMSYFARSMPNSNSAIVVTVSADDVARYGYGTDVFAGMRFQQDLESKAYLAGGGSYAAPCQGVSDFIENRVTDNFDVTPSYPRGVKPCSLRELLPTDICDDIAQSLLVFDRKIRGFATSGVLTGVETRTSSPVKILRDDTFQSNLKRLYPVGEGAGYAGGIVSSAVDGLKVAIAIIQSLSVSS